MKKNSSLLPLKQTVQTWLTTPLPGARTVLLFLIVHGIVGALSWLLAVSSRFPLLNVDAFLALLPIVGMPAAVISVLVSVSVLLSEIFSYDFLIFSVPEFVINFRHLPGIIKLSCYAFMLGIVGVFWLSLRIFKHRHPAYLFAILLSFFVIAKCGELTTTNNLAGSTYLQTRQQLVYAARVLWSADFKQAFKPNSTSSPTHNAVLSALQHHQSIAFIMVESLGIANEPTARQAILESLISTAVESRFNIEFGQVPFRGSTIDGEFRELCNTTLNNLLFKHAPSDCLPKALSRAGYLTSAFHGNDKHFYRRSSWYPEIGFNFIYDIKRLPAPNINQCGGLWNMYCDLDLLDFVSSEISRSGKTLRFDYILTVNSHLPASEMTRGTVRTTSCIQPLSNGVCTHLRNLQRVMHSISQFAIQTSNTVIVIVGDHAPPFTLQTDDEQFNRTHVPYWVLTPRDGSSDTRQSQLTPKTSSSQPAKL